MPQRVNEEIEGFEKHAYPVYHVMLGPSQSLDTVTPVIRSKHTWVTHDQSAHVHTAVNRAPPQLHFAPTCKVRKRSIPKSDIQALTVSS